MEKMEIIWDKIYVVDELFSDGLISHMCEVFFLKLNNLRQKTRPMFYSMAYSVWI